LKKKKLDIPLPLTAYAEGKSRLVFSVILLLFFTAGFLGISQTLVMQLWLLLAASVMLCIATGFLIYKELLFIKSITIDINRNLLLTNNLGKTSSIKPDAPIGISVFGGLVEFRSEGKVFRMKGNINNFAYFLVKIQQTNPNVKINTI